MHDLLNLPLTTWLAFALLLAAACLLPLWALGRNAQSAATAPDGNADIGFYRAQMAELQDDQTRGLLSPESFEAARIELARRLVAAEGRTDPAAASDRTRRRIAAASVVLGVPLVVLGLYLHLGTPAAPAQPLAARLADKSTGDIGTLVSRIEAHLAAKPDDGRGWEVVAPVYTRLGRLEDAANARRNALRLLGSTADREADLGEVLTMLAQSVVTAEAKAAFERAVRVDPQHAKARFFLAMAADQDGDRPKAVAMLERLLADSPADAPWRGLVTQELDRLRGTPPARDPVSPEIRAMVDQLAARLQTDGNDFDGWRRLIRSYAVLGERARAEQALATARARFAADKDRLAELDAMAETLSAGGRP